LDSWSFRLGQPARIWVETTRQDTELTHALERISEHGNRVLRVVYNASVEPYTVVTAYFDRAMKGKL